MFVTACGGRATPTPSDAGAPAPPPESAPPSGGVDPGIVPCEGPSYCGEPSRCPPAFQLGEACTVPWSCEMALTCGESGLCEYRKCSSATDCIGCPGRAFFCDAATARCAPVSP